MSVIWSQVSKFIPFETHVINESHTDIQVHTVWRSVGFACPTQNGAIEPLFSGSWANAEDVF